MTTMTDDPQTENEQSEPEAAKPPKGKKKNGKTDSEAGMSGMGSVSDPFAEGYNNTPGARFSFDPESVFIPGLDDHCDETHPLYDPGVHVPLDKEQVANVKRDGIHQEILITPYLADGVWVPAVLDGRHRTRWLRRANQLRATAGEEKLTIDCRNATDGEIASAVAVKHAANFVRANRHPAARAHACAELHKLGRSNKEIAIDLGVSVSTVENFMAFENAVPEVKKAFEAGKIPVAGVYKIAKLKPEKQADAVKDALALAAPPKAGKLARAKVGDAHAAKRRAKGESDATKRPGISKVRKLLDAAQADPVVFKALTATEPVDFLRWLLGDVTERVLHADVRQVIQGKYKLPKGGED